MTTAIFSGALAMLVPAAAMAQGASAASASKEQRTFDIAPAPLSQAALRFSDQAGVQLLFGGDVADGVRANAVQGRFTVSEALDRLLAGSGLTWRYLSARVITLERVSAAAPSGARTFSAVRVEGVQGVAANGFADPSGFGAGVGANGSSDATATEGTGSLTTNGATIGAGTARAFQQATQTVTVVTRTQIEQQNLPDMTAALTFVPGVTLRTVGQGQTEIVSRGFDITNLQVDGGAPMVYQNIQGVSPQMAPDLSEFDHIEVLRGSDALSGAGNSAPGGSINLVRKRPLDHQQVKVDAELGSFSNGRVEADLTGPLDDAKHIRGRVDVVYQDRDFFYDGAHQTRDHLYGVLEADLGPDTLLRVGGSYGTQQNPGANEFGLPRYTNGDDLHLPRSANISPSWNRHDIKNQELFAELEHRFDEHWTLKLNATELDQFDKEHNGFLSSGIPVGGTSTTLEGVETTRFSLRQFSANATLDGTFQWNGLKQELVTGLIYSRRTFTSSTLEAFPTPTTINVFAGGSAQFGGDPGDLASSAVTIEQDGTVTQQGAYFNLILNPIAPLHISGGLRYGDVRSTNTLFEAGFGFVFANSYTPVRDYGQITPSISVSYDLNQTFATYASFAQVVQPQPFELGQDHKPLPDLTGTTYEVGLRAAPRAAKVNASLALFYTEQDHQAVQVVTPGAVGDCCFEDAGTIKSAGLEFNASGEILPGWQVQAGYTYTNTRYSHEFFEEVAAGGSGSVATTLTQQPKNQVKLFTTYNLPGNLNRWTIGGGFRLESARYTSGFACSVAFAFGAACPAGKNLPFKFTQDLYSVTDLFASYRLSKRWQLGLNITNLTDTRYYATAGTVTGGNFYGEPRAFLVSLKGTF